MQLWWQKLSGLLLILSHAVEYVSGGLIVLAAGGDCWAGDLPDRWRHAPEHTWVDEGPVLGLDWLPAAVHRGYDSLSEGGRPWLGRRHRVRHSSVANCLTDQPNISVRSTLSVV